MNRYAGQAQGGSLFCLLYGRTVPFDDVKLASLCPDHESYVSAFNEATDRAVQERFILPEDAKLMKAAAAASDIGSFVFMIRYSPDSLSQFAHVLKHSDIFTSLLGLPLSIDNTSKPLLYSILINA